MKKYNSIFQYEYNTLAYEKTYQKACFLHFRMLKGEIVFNQFQVNRAELIKDGIILYHLDNRANDGSNYHLMNPEDEGFTLISKREYRVNLLANPCQTLIKSENFAPNLVTDEN